MESLLAGRGDADRRKGLLKRLGHRARIGEMPVLAFVGKPLLRPSLFHYVQCFEKSLAAFRIRHAVGHITARVAAAAYTEQQPAVADLVDGGGLLGKAQRMA